MRGLSGDIQCAGHVAPHGFNAPNGEKGSIMDLEQAAKECFSHNATSLLANLSALPREQQEAFILAKARGEGWDGAAYAAAVAGTCDVISPFGMRRAGDGALVDGDGNLI